MIGIELAQTLAGLSGFCMLISVICCISSWSQPITSTIKNDLYQFSYIGFFIAILIFFIAFIATHLNLGWN